MKNNIQKAEKAFKFYEPILVELIQGREDYDLILAFCENLIKGIVLENDLKTNTDMHFSYLFHKSGAKDSEQETFVEAVYLLSSQILKILVQHFHYRDIVTSHWIEISRKEVFLAFKNNEFYHPQEDYELSLEEFNKVVFPYFVPTREFIEKLEAIQ